MTNEEVMEFTRCEDDYVVGPCDYCGFDVLEGEEYTGGEELTCGVCYDEQNAKGVT